MHMSTRLAGFGLVASSVVSAQLGGILDPIVTILEPIGTALSPLAPIVTPLDALLSTLVGGGVVTLLAGEPVVSGVVDPLLCLVNNVVGASCNGTGYTATSTIMPGAPTLIAAASTTTTGGAASSTGNASATASATASSTAAAPTSTLAQFALRAVSLTNANLPVRRRQVAGAGAVYLASSGLLTATCTDAVSLEVEDGELFAPGFGQFSTNAGVANAPFIANEDVGTITTLFTSGGSLQWANGAFFGGAASFCSLASSGEIFAVFTDAPPADCDPVILVPEVCGTAGNGATPTGTGTNSITNGDITNSTVNNIINNGIIDTTTYNIGEINNVLPGGVLAQFQNGAINYYSGDSCYYYAKCCPTCEIVQVYKANNTYATQTCPVCPVEVQQIPAVQIVSCTNQTEAISGSSQAPVAGVAVYPAATCLVCEGKAAATVAPVSPTGAVVVPTVAPTAPVIATGAAYKSVASAFGLIMSGVLACAILL